MADNEAMSVRQRAMLLAMAFEGLAVPEDTPLRVARWLNEYQGSPRHMQDDDQWLSSLQPLFEDPHNELVIVKDIRFTALCEHHLLPFWGHGVVSYIPDGLVMGLSKAARLLHYFCQRPTLQEHITTHVADALMQGLKAKGAMVVLNAQHSCMSMRGIKDPEASTTTSAVRGVFRDSSTARAEVLGLLR